MKNNYLGQMIKTLRLEQNLSQRKLGEILGFSNQTVSFWEIGRLEPNIDTLIKIAQYFEVSCDYLLGLED